MENRPRRKRNEPQIPIKRIAEPAPRRSLPRPPGSPNPVRYGRTPDPVRLAKIKKRHRRKVRNQLFFLSAALTVLIAAAVLIVLAVRGCSGGSTDALGGESTPDGTAAHTFEGTGGKKDALCGKWDLDGTTVYAFDGMGSGLLELPENEYIFRYEIKDGTVNIDFAEDKVRDISYKFTVDSDELILERKEKNDTVVHKLKKQTGNPYE